MRNGSVLPPRLWRIGEPPWPEGYGATSRGYTPLFSRPTRPKPHFTGVFSSLTRPRAVPHPSHSRPGWVAVASKNRFSVPTGPILETAAWAVGSYRDLPSVAFPGSKFHRSGKIAQFYSVLLSLGLVGDNYQVLPGPTRFLQTPTGSDSRLEFNPDKSRMDPMK